jgi:hypothetical protein
LSEGRLLADFVAEFRCRLQRPHCALPRPVSARAVYRISENRRNDVNACAYRKPSARAIVVVHVGQQHVAQMGERGPLLRTIWSSETNRSLLGLARRSTLICCLSTRLSASSATRDRNRSLAIQKISRHESCIGNQHRAILIQLPARLNLRKGQRKSRPADYCSASVLRGESIMLPMGDGADGRLIYLQPKTSVRKVRKHWGDLDSEAVSFQPQLAGVRTFFLALDAFDIHLGCGEFVLRG